MKNCCITIKRRLPPSLNTYLTMHWRKRQELKTTWEELIRTEWVRMRRPKFTGPVELYYWLEFDTYRHRDFDNYVGGTKPLTDALKGTFIVDDSAKHVRSVTVHFVQGNVKQTGIEIISCK